MKTLEINIDKEVYSVEHAVTTINLYKIKHPKGYIEVTRNRYNGKWKILSQSDSSIDLPLEPIGKAIEEHLDIIN